MDSFLDKLGVYDFFNLIGAGGVFVCGIHVIGVVEIKKIISLMGTGNGVLDVALFLGMCFLIGAVFQSLGSVICKGDYKKQLMDHLLSDNSEVVKNEIARENHKKRANKLLSDSDLTVEDVSVETLYEFYFSHSEHSIHVYNKDSKTERMRNLRGLSSTLMGCFSVLVLIAVLKIVFNNTLSFFACGVDRNIMFLFVLCVVFVGMALFNRMAYQRNTLFWMQMVLDVYQASTDCENNFILRKDE